MSPDDQGLDPVIEQKCARCGAPLTSREIEVSLDAGGPYLCSVHAIEELPVEDEDESAYLEGEGTGP